MVHGIETLGFIIPFQKREVGYPQRLEHIALPQSQPCSHLQTESSKGNLGLVFRTAEYENEVSLLSIARLCDFLYLLRSVELVYRRLYLIAELNEDKALGSYLRALYPLC